MKAAALVLCMAATVPALCAGASAQREDGRGGELVDRPSAARTRLIRVGHWVATEDGGAFYLQFRANGTYTYTHIDGEKVVRAQQAGRFELKLANLKEQQWPGVVGPGTDHRRGRGFILTLRPASIEVPASDPPGLPGDDPADYRVAFVIGEDAAQPELEWLAASESPDGTFGRLRFRRGP